MSNDYPMAGPTMPRRGTKVALLANPTARRNRSTDDIGSVVGRLRSLGLEPLVLESASMDQARAAAHHVVEMGIPRLVALGGDGTVHLAADAVAGSSTVLGVVASGTGNDFAGALGLTSGDLSARVDRALADPTAVDLIARVNGRSSSNKMLDKVTAVHAVTSCIAGFPAIVNVRAEALRRPRGSSRYTLATLLTISGMRPLHLRLTCRGGPDDARTVDQRCAVVAVANTGLFGGGMRICPDARPDDGLLDVCLVGDVGRFELLRAFPTVRTGAHLDHPAVTTLRVSEVDLELLPSGVDDLDEGNLIGAESGHSSSHHLARLRADGEPFGSLPCTLVTRPGALWIAGASTNPPGRA
ncbi:MAG: sphingosine kinase [Acidimicrobiaceae bacterium]|nr:sphingosine kinase [Acidimicrobiaceae bacterium]